MRLCSAHMLVLVASFLCGLGGCRNVSIESNSSEASLIYAGVDYLTEKFGVLSSRLCATDSTAYAVSTGEAGDVSSLYCAAASTATTPTGSSTGAVPTGSLTTTRKGATSTTNTQVVSGTSAPTTTHATSTKATSASPSSKKNFASQCGGFVGGAGILLLIALLAGL